MSDLFSKQTLGWHRDARCRALKHPSYKWLNSVLWALCVEHRTETLPEYITATDIAYESGIDVRTVRKGLTFMSTQMQPLIKVLDNGQIHVFGVREMHETPKFLFKQTKDICEDINDGIDEDINEDIDVVIDAPKSEPREEKSRKDKSKTKETAPEVQRVFDFFIKVNNKSDQYKLSSDRIKLIEKARKRHDDDSIVHAIRCHAASDFHASGGYTGLRYAIAKTRDKDYVEEWASKTPEMGKAAATDNQGGAPTIFTDEFRAELEEIGKKSLEKRKRDNERNQ